MRTPATLILCTTLALALSGCGGSDDATPDRPSPTSSATPSGDPAAEPSAEPSEEPTPTPDVPAPSTDLPAEVMLPADALEPSEGPREETETVTDWRVPTTCLTGPPPGALAMRTVTQGDGLFEVPVGVHQVAVFADADAAVAEADRLRSGFTTCAEAGAVEQTIFLSEDVAVGAQGVGLATDYYGVGTDEALGSYLAVTRRGNAVTLVSAEGGESSVGAARDVVTGDLQEAWDLLCRYDSAGC